MSITGMPEWLQKMQEVWRRRDTAGFYELQEIVESTIDLVERQTREEIERRTLFGAGPDYFGRASSLSPDTQGKEENHE